jgi:catalase
MSAVDQDLAVRLVDAVNGLYGVHPHSRAAHAKGIYGRATFTPTPDAARRSRAAHFRAPVSALVRFSNGSGDPQSHDGAVDGRGLAVKFDAGDGAVTDIVALTLPVFFVRTPQDFLEFTAARTPDPQTGKPDMAKVGAYLGAHPEAMPAVQAALAAGPPASYAQLTYNGIHAFRLVDAGGNGTFVRYRLSPEAGEAALDRDEAMARDRDYLRPELEQRLAAGPAAFRLSATIAAADDPVDDPTAVWPEDRQQVELGRLEITAVAEDPERDGSVVVFDPTNVIDGIEPSNDPILRARQAAYSESATRRLR